MPLAALSIDDQLRRFAPYLAAELLLWPGRRERFHLYRDYYANPMSAVPADNTELSDRFYRQAQERGLPIRITGQRSSNPHCVDSQRKEVVIENDIAWRIDTMVDLLLGHSPLIESVATDAGTRRDLTATFRAVLDSAGGTSLLQEIATLAAIYGFADIVIKPDDTAATGVRLEVVDPLTAVPIVDPLSAADLLAYARVIDLTPPAAARLLLQPGVHAPRTIAGLDPATFSNTANHQRLIELYFPSGWARLLQGRLIASGESGGVGTAAPGLPVVRFANVPSRRPWQAVGQTGGRGEIEPLIPMQDELNVRLSDRAYRMALTSAPMFLAAGIGDMPRVPLGPGRVWSTDNAAAKIMTFGGDPGVPSEDMHIGDVREALDKISGVSPIAAGAIKQKLGNLSSAAALRVTLQSLTTKTIRKRAAYSQGLGAVARQIFELLARTGRIAHRPEDWGIEVLWGPILPEDASEQLAQAQAKINLGIPARIVLKELGYDLPEAARQPN